jgi:hypothetical protein
MAETLSESDMSNDSVGGVHQSIEEVPPAAAPLHNNGSPTTPSDANRASSFVWSSTPLSMTGGRNHNMVGTYKEHILANAKFLYGPHETYDVVTAHDLEGEENATSYAAYLVAWSKTADEGMILRKVRNKYPGMEVALGQLNKQVEFSVGMVMEGKKEGDVIGKGELEKLALQK